VLLKFGAEVGHVLGRVLQQALPVGGLDGRLAGISRHVEHIIRIERILGLDGRRPAPSPARFLLFFELPARFLPLTRFQLLRVEAAESEDTTDPSYDTAPLFNDLEAIEEVFADGRP